MFPSYRNQSIDFDCKSIDLFLYEKNLFAPRLLIYFLEKKVLNPIFSFYVYYLKEFLVDTRRCFNVYKTSIRRRDVVETTCVCWAVIPPNFRGVFRTQSNIYDEAFLQKYRTAFKHQLFSQKSPITGVRMGSKYVS